MPRFYFHVSDGRRRLFDTVGREFASIRAARTHAVATLRDARAALCERELRDLSGWSLSVTNEKGRCVLSLGFDLRPHDSAPLAPEDGERIEAEKFFAASHENLPLAGGSAPWNAPGAKPKPLSRERVGGGEPRPEKGTKFSKKKS